MKFTLASKTESEFNNGKVQMHFRVYVEPNGNPVSQPAAPISPTSEINLSGLWLKDEADLYQVGKTYRMILEEVTESA